MTSKQLWGEIPPTRSDEPFITSQLTCLTPHSQKELNVLGAKFYPHDFSAHESKKVTDAIPCQRTLHTIKLYEYYQKYHSLVLELQEILEAQCAEKSGMNNNSKLSIEQSEKSNKEKSPRKKSHFKDLPIISTSYSVASPIPEAPELMSSVTKKNSNKLMEDSQFVKGIGETPPQISNDVAWKLLQKAVAVNLAHTGFESTSNEVLNMLTDVAENYFCQLCQAFKRHASRRYTKCPLFPDVLYRTFKDEGIRNFAVLGNFYEKRVVQYHNEMMERCEEVYKEYEKLRQSPKICEILKNAKNSKGSSSKSDKNMNIIAEDNLDEKDPELIQSSHVIDHKKGSSLKRMKTKM